MTAAEALPRLIEILEVRVREGATLADLEATLPPDGIGLTGLRAWATRQVLEVAAWVEAARAEAGGA